MSIKWDKQKVADVIQEAREVGAACAREKLRELQGAGPQFEVTDGNGVCQGQLLDVCGFATIKIPARGGFYTHAKALSEFHQYRMSCGRAYGGGGRLSIFDSTMRQEMSVNKAACVGQLSVLAKYDIIGRVETRID